MEDRDTLQTISRSGVRFIYLMSPKKHSSTVDSTRRSAHKKLNSMGGGTMFVVENPIGTLGMRLVSRLGMDHTYEYDLLKV